MTVGERQDPAFGGSDGGSRALKVLFLAQCLPYPPHSGVTNRIFHILSAMSKEFEVTLLPFFRRNHQRGPEEIGAAEKALGPLVSAMGTPVPIPGELSAVRRLWDHLRSIFKGVPYTYHEYDSRAFKQAFKSYLASQPWDVLHIDSLDLYGYLGKGGEVASFVTCTHHSIESELLRRRATMEGNRLFRAYLNYQAGLIEQVEREWCSRIDLNFMMSTIDADHLKRLSPDACTEVVPNGVDVKYFEPRPRSTSDKLVLFVGPLYMRPNRDALEFFCEAVWPEVRARVPDARLVQVGKCSDGQARRFRRYPGVDIKGYQVDIRPSFADALCTVVPIRIGGGTRLKILDAWAMGRAVVSTGIGCEGLEVVEGENILVRDEPQKFGRAVADVLEDEALRRRLEEHGRLTAVRKYSWRKIGDSQCAALRRLVGEQRSGD